MKRFLWMALLLAAAGAAPAGTVSIKGSNTFGEELGPRLIEDFRKLHPDVTMTLESAGSGSGILALLEGGCDIASSSRSMTEDELRLARSRKIVLRNYTIGYYGVAVVVHPDNPVLQLTDRQVRGLFTGTLTNWSQVGGADRAVQPCIRDPVSGTYLGFQELAMDRQPYAATARPFTNYAGIAHAVREDRGAIGYMGMTLAGHSGVRALVINGVEPTAQNVADQLYPYARQLRLYTNRRHESPAAKEFLTFSRSQPGQNILEQLGYVRRSQLKLPTRDSVP